MKKKLLAAALAGALVMTGFHMEFLYGGVTAQAEEKSGTIIDVTDFGADPSGKKDSTDAVAAALEEAKETEGDVTISFPKGDYHFWKDYASKRTYHTSNTSSLSYPEKSIGILLENVDNVTLEGNGSSLIMHGDMMAAAVVDSSNVTFHDFILDYKDPDTIDISVVGNGTDESGRQYTDFYVPANYNYEINEGGTGITWQGEISPVTGRPYWEKQSADFCAYLVIYKGYDQTVARASNKAASNPFTGAVSIEKTGENVLRFTYSGNRPKDQEEGNIFLLSDSATRKTTGAFFWESENLLVDDIDVHYLSGFGWLTQMCKNVEFRKVDFLPRYGTGKYTTSNADQLHVAGCGGYFKVTDCNFSMAHDDPINIHGSYMRVEEVIDSRTLKVQYINGQQGGFRQFHAGDEVLFYSRTYLEPPEGEDENEPYIVEDSCGPGEEYNGQKLDMRTEVVTFAEEFDEETLNDLSIKVTRNNSAQKEGLYVAENVTYTPAVTISGNHMKSIPTRGILCTTRQPVIIEDNVFDNMAMANIYLSNDADYWYESGPIRDMVIRNNQFYIRSTGQAEWGDVSGIFVDPVVLTGVQDAPASKGDIPVHRNITIEGNEFYMGNDNVVTAEDVDGLKILNNKIIRDAADIEIALSAVPGIGVGEVMDIRTDVKETTLTKDIFKFTNCKNVEISGNTYDDGLNLNVTTAGQGMTEADVEIKDDVLTLNSQNGNLITSASKVKYVTSDPDVAYVDEQGRLVGVSEGEVALWAYAEWNGTIIKSNEVTVQVGKDAGSSVSISASRTEVNEEGGTADLTYTEGAVIEVVDPVTGADAGGTASVSDRTYTALKEGLVLVRASKDGKTAGVLMINSFPKSYGDPAHMMPQVTVDNKNAANLSGAKNEITIKAETGSELYAGSAYVKNLVKFQIPDELKNDLRVQVDVSGLPIQGDGYNNAGIILYKDGNNYYSVGKKGHMSGVTAVYEENAASSERSGDSADSRLTDTTFEIEIQNNTAAVRYIDASGAWKTADTQADIGSITGGDVYLALCAWKNSGSDFSTGFRNVKIAKASETTTEDMSTVSAEQIFDAVSNERPFVSDLTLRAGKVNESAEVSAQAADGDGTVARMIYQWVLTDENGREITAFTEEGTYTPTEEGRLQVFVTAVDNYGKPSVPAASRQEMVSIGSSGTETLNQLYINGSPVEDFDKDGAEFILPEGSTEKLRVSYSRENAGVSTVIKDGEGKILARLKDENAAVIDCVPRLVIERGEVSYEVTVRTQKESNVEVRGLRVNGREIDLEKDVIRDGTDSYFVQLKEDDVQLIMTAADKDASIEVTRSFFNIGVENVSGEPGIFEADVDLTAGINAFYFTVTGADGVSAKIVRLYLFRDGHNESALSDLKVNGQTVEGFTADQKEYTVYIDAQDKRISVEAVQGADEQTTSITMNGVRTEGTFAECEPGPGLNQIIVSNRSENMWTTSCYTLNVAVKSADNADLLRLDTDEKLSPEFDPLAADVTDYAIVTHKGRLHIDAQALMDTAQIRVFSESKEEKAKGSISTDLDLYEGENTAGIEVTSPDGTVKKVYTIHIDAQGLDYASDRMDLATKAEVGYGTLQLDLASSGGVLALADEEGGRVEFEKGLGAHAQSEIAYNIDGQGYTKFEAYVGIDYYQVAQGEVPSSVTFRVLVDGVEMFNSGEMTVHDPMRKVEVDITGARTIQLFADQGANNYNDHADWADAKFLRPLEEKPQKPQEPVSKTILERFLNEAKGYVEDGTVSGLVESVQKLFADAIAKGEAVMADENAAREDVIDAAADLMFAIHALGMKAADKTDLEMALELAEMIDLSRYVEAGQEEYLAAKEAAEAVLTDGDAMQAVTDEAWNRLVETMSGLRLKADKAALEELLDSVADLDLNLYTEDSVQILRAAFATANAVLADESLTADDQKTVDDAARALAEAKDGLKLRDDISGGEEENPGTGEGEGNEGSGRGTIDDGTGSGAGDGNFDSGSSSAGNDKAAGNTENAGTGNENSGGSQKAAKTGDAASAAGSVAAMVLAAVMAARAAARRRQRG